MPMIFNYFTRHIWLDMEKENESKTNKLDALAKCVLRQQKDIKKLIQPLMRTWNFVEEEKIGKNRWISFTDDGKNASEFLF